MRKLLVALLLLPVIACSQAEFFIPRSVNEAGEVGGNSVMRKARVHYNFTELTGANAAAISNGNSGLVDQSGNGHTATIVGTPVIRDVTINAETIKTLHDVSTNAINTGITGAIDLATSFEVYMVVQLQDGQPAGTVNFFGGIKPTNIGVNMYINTAGQVGFALGTTSGFYNWLSTAAVFTNGVNATCALRLRVNHGGDVRLWKNGVSVIGSITVGTINTPTTAQIPTDFTTNLYVGALNNNGTTTTNADIISIFNFAILPMQSITSDIEMNFTIESLMSFTWDNWESKEIHINSGNAATLRSDAIADYFNGAGLPTVAPVVTTSVTGPIHIANTANLTNFTTVDRYAFTMNDVDGHPFTNYVYLIDTDQPENGKLFINNMGHNSDCASCHESMMNTALSYGYDVAWTAMVVGGDNVESCPDITSTSSTGHNQFLSNGVDRVGYAPIELFLFDKFSFIDYAADNLGYSQIITVGNSGGGWTSTIVGALDERVDYTFSVRGSSLRNFKFRETAGDYEQGGFPSYMWTTSILGSTLSGTRLYQIYTDVTYFDLFALGTTSGRVVYSLTHNDDSCCFTGTGGWVSMDLLKSLAGQFGGEFHNIIDFNPNRATHGYSYYDINNVFHALGDL